MSSTGIVGKLIKEKGMAHSIMPSYNSINFLPQIACDDFLLNLRKQSSSLWYEEAKRGEE